MSVVDPTLLAQQLVTAPVAYRKGQRPSRYMEASQRTTSFSGDGLTQVLMGYRGRKTAAVLPDWKPREGFLYTQVRAISARINQNYDGWPSEELRKSYRSFLGKPVFVNHKNDDYRKARGKVIAARYIESGDDKYIEVIQEIDAKRFPKLAKEIREGGLDSVSMGVEAGFTICSYCDNKAVDDRDFCDHVRHHKGQILRKGSRDILVYEKCYKLGFFELSYVFDPADETAVVSRVVQAGHQRRAYGEVEAPADVDTLRNEGEDEDDDFHHYVESPRELQEPDMDEAEQLDREQEDQGLDEDRRAEDAQDYGPGGEEVDDHGEPDADDEGGAPDFDADDDHGTDGGSDIDAVVADYLDYCVAADVPPDQDSLADYANSTGMSDDDFAEIAQFLDDAMSQGTPVDSTPGGDMGGPAGPPPGADQGGVSGQFQPGGETGDSMPDFGGAGPDQGDDYGDEDEHGQLPINPPQMQAGRRPVSRASSGRKGQKGNGGDAMSLAQRARVATAGRRFHSADNGYTDGPTYGEDNQGEQEEVFLSQTPGAESVAAPVPGDGTISNTENNLVASIKYHSAKAQKDLNRYQALKRMQARRHQGEALEDPTVVNPPLSGTDEQSLKGSDFQDTNMEDVETQPKDASKHAFRAFDQWLHQTTGRQAALHHPNFIKREATRWAAHYGQPVEILYPALGNLLRAARKDEGKKANVRRYADESLEVAAPQDRIDVEKPVSNTTDEKAQSSQFDLGDFAHNAGDQLADPDLSVDSQIWAPGEGGTKESSRRASAALAVRYAENCIEAGLAPASDKYKIIGQAETMRHAVVNDRVRLLESVLEVNRRAARRVAAEVSRGSRALPRGIAGAARTASAPQQISNDRADDIAFFIK